MTIFISCSLADKDIFDELAEHLRQRGHIIYPRSGKYLSSLLITSLRKDITESDFFVALISEDYSNSKIALTELNFASFTGNSTILPFILGSASVPVSVADIDCEKADSKEELVEKVLNCITLLENTEKHEDSPGCRDQKNGNQKDGNQEDGNLEVGIWKKGIWKKGIWKKRIWKKGIWKKRIWKKGIWKTGIWKKGIWKTGIWIAIIVPQDFPMRIFQTMEFQTTVHHMAELITGL